MLGYYKKHIFELTKRLRKLEENMENLNILVETQLYILKRIYLTENKIKTLKGELKILKSICKRDKLPKENSAINKKKIKFIQNRIKQYQWLLYVWRSFGDGIAFIYLDKWAIKPFLYNAKTPDVKQPAGNIFWKKGLGEEFALVLNAQNNGVPALLNDLTNTIRHGDVCLLGASDPHVIEVKSSSNKNKRVERQLEQIKHIHDYLKNDEGANVRGAPYAMREEQTEPEVNYLSQINKMINEALEKGYSKRSPEAGVHYAVLTGPKKRPDLDTLLGEIKQGLFFPLNQSKNDQSWGCYYPFTLSIRDPEALYAFLKGDIYILVIFDAAIIKKLSFDLGFSFSILDENDWAYKFERRFKNSDEPEYLKVSGHFAHRMAFEFLSLKWTLNWLLKKRTPSVFDKMGGKDN